MLNPPNFFENSFGYLLLKKYIKFWHNIIFYDKVKIIGDTTLLTDNKPLILVANHQNSLMDPLAILLSLKNIQPIFLARADVFRASWIKKMLTFLKMLPIYRPRDGNAAMANNDVVFEKCVELLTQKRCIGLFPEGTHNPTFELQKLKKGTARIALKAEIENNWQLGLEIVPIALHFSDLNSMGADLTIQFGKPFSVSYLQQINEASPAKAVNELTERIEEEIKEQMNELATKLPINKHFFNYKWLILLPTALLALVGFVGNSIPFYTPFLITKRLKDKQFVSSVRFVMYALATFPMYYLLMFGVLSSFLGGMIAAILLIFTALSGFFAHQWAKLALY